MIDLTTRYLEMGERALADSMRLSSICMDCAARLGSIQAEVAGTFLLQQAFSFPQWLRGEWPDRSHPDPIAAGYRDAPPMVELMYCVGEANRVLVDSQSQLRMILDENLGEAGPDNAARSSAARAVALAGRRPLKGARPLLKPRNVRLSRMKVQPEAPR
jgi:hypothetical protein